MAILVAKDKKSFIRKGYWNIQVEILRMYPLFFNSYQQFVNKFCELYSFNSLHASNENSRNRCQRTVRTSCS